MAIHTHATRRSTRLTSTSYARGGVSDGHSDSDVAMPHSAADTSESSQSSGDIAGNASAAVNGKDKGSGNGNASDDLEHGARPRSLPTLKSLAILPLPNVQGAPQLLSQGASANASTSTSAASTSHSAPASTLASAPAIAATLDRKTSNAYSLAQSPILIDTPLPPMPASTATTSAYRPPPSSSTAATGHFSRPGVSADPAIWNGYTTALRTDSDAYYPNVGYSLSREQSPTALQQPVWQMQGMTGAWPQSGRSNSIYPAGGGGMTSSGAVNTANGAYAPDYGYTYGYGNNNGHANLYPSVSAGSSYPAPAQQQHLQDGFYYNSHAFPSHPLYPSTQPSGNNTVAASAYYQGASQPALGAAGSDLRLSQASEDLHASPALGLRQNLSSANAAASSTGRLDASRAHSPRDPPPRSASAGGPTTATSSGRGTPLSSALHTPDSGYPARSAATKTSSIAPTSNVTTATTSASIPASSAMLATTMDRVAIHGPLGYMPAPTASPYAQGPMTTDEQDMAIDPSTSIPMSPFTQRIPDTLTIRVPVDTTETDRAAAHILAAVAGTNGANGSTSADNAHPVAGPSNAHRHHHHQSARYAVPHKPRARSMSNAGLSYGAHPHHPDPRYAQHPYGHAYQASYLWEPSAAHPNVHSQYQSLGPMRSRQQLYKYPPPAQRPIPEDPLVRSGAQYPEYDVPAYDVPRDFTRQHARYESAHYPSSHEQKPRSYSSSRAPMPYPPARRSSGPEETPSTTATKTESVAGSEDTAVERPFPCPGCDRTFARRYDRNRHARQHTGEKPYVCLNPKCGDDFGRPDALQRHYRAHAVCAQFKPKVITRDRGENDHKLADGSKGQADDNKQAGSATSGSPAEVQDDA